MKAIRLNFYEAVLLWAAAFAASSSVGLLYFGKPANALLYALASAFLITMYYLGKFYKAWQLERAMRFEEA